MSAQMDKETRMNRWALLAALVVMSGCSTVAVTDRSQLNLVSTEEEEKQGAQAFNEVKSSSRLSGDPKMNAMLRRVGERIAKAANKPEYKWEFILIEDDAVANAFCLPGGRVAFFTGILPITKDESGMATVMSHEVAHALAHHSREQMSRDRAAGALKSVAISRGYLKSPGQSMAVDAFYKVGIGLPHNRAQEAEADHIGLVLMAKAGYDPRKSLAFWERMKAATGQGKKLAILSTHPSDEARIKEIQEELPEALKEYHPTH